MMDGTSNVPDSAILEHPDAGIRIRFHWTFDRYEHIVEGEHGQLHCISESTAKAWPKSPPVQQLSIESIDQRDVALGVGCSGKSHFSLSVEPVKNGFRFDWACRTREPAPFLGTTYRDSPHFAIEPLPESVLKAATVEAAVVPAGPTIETGTHRWRYQIRVR